jgi:hypothetical protein
VPFAEIVRYAQWHDLKEADAFSLGAPDWKVHLAAGVDLEFFAATSGNTTQTALPPDAPLCQVPEPSSKLRAGDGGSVVGGGSVGPDAPPPTLMAVQVYP